MVPVYCWTAGFISLPACWIIQRSQPHLPTGTRSHPTSCYYRACFHSFHLFSLLQNATPMWPCMLYGVLHPGLWVHVTMTSCPSHLAGAGCHRFGHPLTLGQKSLLHQQGEKEVIKIWPAKISCSVYALERNTCILYL